MADEYQVRGGVYQKAYSAPADADAGNRGQAALDQDAMDRRRSALIASKEGSTTSGDDPEPQAKDFPGLGAFAQAHGAWKDRQASKNPQATAVKGMLQKRANVDAAATEQK